MHNNITISFLQLKIPSFTAIYPIIAKQDIIKLYIPEQINSRLEELNNNNFIIEDQATDELNKVD